MLQGGVGGSQNVSDDEKQKIMDEIKKIIEKPIVIQH